MRRLAGNAVLADDLAQEVFLQTWRKIRQLKVPRVFPADSSKRP
jgi:DNA-directed RNA polymerase specialized sigma24 family protein